MTQIQVQQIKSLVSLPEVMNAIGIRIRNRRRADCPFCTGRSKATFSFESSGLWHCFRCDAGGDSISFVMLVLRVDFLSALVWMAHLGGLSFEESRFSRADFQSLRSRRFLIQNERRRFEKWRKGLARKLRSEHRNLSQSAAYAADTLAGMVNKGGRIRESPKTEYLWQNMADWYHRELPLTEALDFIDLEGVDTVYKEWCKHGRPAIK